MLEKAHIFFIPKKAVEYFSPEYFEMLAKTMGGKYAWGYIPVFDNEEHLKACFPDVDYDVVDARTFNVKHEEIKTEKPIHEG